jgi:hypothetical protein
MKKIVEFLTGCISVILFFFFLGILPGAVSGLIVYAATASLGLGFIAFMFPILILGQGIFLP